MEELSYQGLEKEKSEIAFCLLKEGVKDGKIVDFEVASNCMSPLFKAGDKVSIRDISLNELKIGDIIAYKVKSHLYVHRYIFKSQKDGNFFKFVTKADNMLNFDQYLVSSQELLGKVITIKGRHGEIELENIFWRINNYLSALISYFQVYIVELCCYIKRFVFGKKNLYFASFIRKSIIFPLSLFLKSMVIISSFISRISYQKNIKTRH